MLTRLCILFLVASLSLAAKEEKKPSTFTKQCHVCESANEPECADEFKSSKFKTDCDTTKPTGAGFSAANKAVGCRKILQEVAGEYRVVRQCAYSGEDTHAFKRTGNEGVRMFYYQCSDSDFCNSSSFVSLSLAAFVLPLLAALLR